MNVLFLGTAAGKPSNHRNVTSIAVILNDAEFVLVDCGEATQHQLMKSTLRISKLRGIFITHMHGDHIFGLPGLLCTLSEVRTQNLTIFGPPGIKSYLFDALKYSHLHYKLDIYEFATKNPYCEGFTSIQSGNHTYTFDSCQVEHTIRCYAYKITQHRNNLKIDMNKLNPDIQHYFREIEELGFSPPQQIIKHLKGGMKITMDDDFVFDGRNYAIVENTFSLVIALDNYNSKRMVENFKSCDVLIHECTYAVFPKMNITETKIITDTAIKNGHSTNQMGFEVAQKLGASKIIFTHFSNRYEFEDEDNIISGANPLNRPIETLCARDFTEFCICSK